MGSTFEAFRRLGPAAFVVKAIIAAVAADVFLLVFILLRRTYRTWYFAKRDARAFALRQDWEALISGEIPYETWRTRPFDRRIIQTMVLDKYEGAGSEESARLLHFLRSSGLIEKQIFEARHHFGWRRHRALVALGRTRAPEAIPALSEGLRDGVLQTRLAALRGLERMACPQAAQEILDWVAQEGLRVPALPLQGALIQCCAERPQMLLPYLQHTEMATREVLARVLGEVAVASLGTDLLRFVDDGLPELRAASARALIQIEPRLALEALSQLAEDSVWFVRLRAVVSLGELHRQAAIAPLLRRLGDSHRLVRLRAAEALVGFKQNLIGIFEQVVASHDRYGLHAYLAALDNAALQSAVEAELRSSAGISEEVRGTLLAVLSMGRLPDEGLVQHGMAHAAGSRI